jgi:hypothetical protein
VIAARAGGITDIVTDGVNGCLFDPNDPAGLTLATRRMLDSASLRDELHRNARQEAERWSWAAATDSLRDYYRSVLEGGPIAAGPSAPKAAPRAAGSGSCIEPAPLLDDRSGADLPPA